MNRLVRLCPLLLFYVVVILVSAQSVFVADEAGYVEAAVRLSEGAYSSSADVRLWWGPGYPLLLAPFVLLQLPWLAAKALNGVLLFAAILFSYGTLRAYVSERAALFASYMLGMYVPFLRESYVLMAEPLTVFLISGFTFYFCKALRSPASGIASILTAALFLAYLALTKVFFGYVLLAGWILFLLVSLWKKHGAFSRAHAIYGAALIFCLPYLLYTYAQTGRLFYWATSGGMSLYTMSSPHAEEYGDWFNHVRVGENPALARNHGEFFRRIDGLGEVERDDEFKKEAARNIVQHPGQFLRNWVANIGRLLFQYPYSYTSQKLSTYFYIVPNMILVTLLLLSFYPYWRARRMVPHEIVLMLLFALIAFLGSSLLSAYTRQFYVLVPVFVLWLTVIMHRFVRVGVPADRHLPARVGRTHGDPTNSRDGDALIAAHQSALRDRPQDMDLARR